MVLDAVSPYLRFARGLVLRDRPIYLHFAVTSRCNLRCKSCVIWRRGKIENELSLDEVGRLADMARRLGCIQVSLGGGEPCLRDDLPDMVRAFSDRGIRCRVLSNGVALTPAVARRLVGAGLREVSVSFDSLDPATQDEMDSAPTFGKRLENLLALAEMLPRRGALPLLNTVVTSKNFAELEGIVAFAEALGFFVSFIPVHLSGAGGEHRFYADAPDLRLDDQRRLREVYARVLALKRRGAPIINSSAFLRQSPDYLLTGRAPWPCDAGELFLSVGPDGAVAACHAFEGRDEVPFAEFEAAFFAPSYRESTRARVRTCEGCFRPCWAEVGYLFHDRRALLEMAAIQLRTRLRPRTVDRRAALALVSE